MLIIFVAPILPETRPFCTLTLNFTSNRGSLLRVTIKSDEDSLQRVVDPTQQVTRAMSCQQKKASQVPRGTSDTATATLGPARNKKANKLMPTKQPTKSNIRKPKEAKQLEPIAKRQGQAAKRRQARRLTRVLVLQRQNK